MSHSRCPPVSPPPLLCGLQFDHIILLDIIILIISAIIPVRLAALTLYSFWRA